MMIYIYCRRGKPQHCTQVKLQHLSNLTSPNMSQIINYYKPPYIRCLQHFLLLQLPLVSQGDNHSKKATHIKPRHQMQSRTKTVFDLISRQRCDLASAHSKNKNVLLCKGPEVCGRSNNIKIMCITCCSIISRLDIYIASVYSTELWLGRATVTIG